MRIFKNVKYQPIAIALLSLIVFVIIILQYTEFNQEKKEQDVRGVLLETLILKKSQIEKSLYSRIYYTKGIAAYISINSGAFRKFKENNYFISVCIICVDFMFSIDKIYITKLTSLL